MRTDTSQSVAAASSTASATFVEKIADVCWSVFELKHFLEYRTEPDFFQPITYVGSVTYSFELEVLDNPDYKGFQLSVGNTGFLFDEFGNLLDWNTPHPRSEEVWIEWLNGVVEGL